MQPDLIVAIDQGTTGTTVLLVDAARTVRGRGYQEFAQIYPRPGEVEHDPEAIWSSVLGALGQALAGIDTRRIAALGITNQRETTLLWEPEGGRSRGGGARADRAGAGSVFLGHQNSLAAGQRLGLARPRRGRRHRLWDGRHVPDLAAHRRAKARHRRD